MQMQLVIDNPIYQFPLEGGAMHQITEGDIQRYKTVFPRLDIDQQLRILVCWNEDNPKKRKTKKGVKNHIRNWLTSAYSKHQNFPPNNSSTRSQSLVDDLTDRSWAM